MKNFIQEGDVLAVVATYPAVPVSGDMVLFGSMTGIAVLNEGEGGCAATETMVSFEDGVYDLLVATSGAISVGDVLFLHAASPCVLNNVSGSGYFFGFALEVIASGSDTINVLHVQSPGAGTLGAGTVGTTELAANGTTAAKLTATLRTGFIPLDIANARIIGTNQIAAVVGAATDPILSRNDTNTDIAARLSWASASVVEIQFPPVCYPPDLDDSAAVTVKILARMKAASVNTPVLAVKYFEGEGDSTAGGNTGALSTTLAAESVTIAAGDVGAAPTMASISVTPGAHNTASNDVYVFGAWLEYTRK